jgi:hypothetical protein
MIWAWIGLAAFFGVWVCVAVYGKSQQWSGIYRFGGGFIAACSIVGGTFSLIANEYAKNAPPAEAAAKVEPVKPLTPNLGKTYAQLMKGLDEYFSNMENSRLASGEFRRMGNSEQTKALAIYEIVGEPGVPASRASLSFFAVRDSAIPNIGNMNITFIVVRNIFPDWTEGPKAVMNGLMELPKRKLKPTAINETQFVHDGKAIRLSFIKELGMFNIEIFPQKN